MEFIITILVMDIFIVLLIYRRLRNRFHAATLQAKSRLNYIRILADTVYTYSHRPELLQKQLQKELSIKKLMAYHVIEGRCDRFFSSTIKVNRKDQLLYMLYKEGFTPRELCVIFELNNLNSVYVKCHRIKKKLHTEKALEDIPDNRKVPEAARVPAPAAAGKGTPRDKADAHSDSSMQRVAEPR